MKKQFDTGSNIIHLEQTPFQEICVKEHHDHGKILLLDGEVQFTEAHERQYHDTLFNCLHEIDCVLIVGGGDMFLANNLVNYMGAHVDIAEIDERMPIIARDFFGADIDDPMININIIDGLEYIEHAVDQHYQYGAVVFDVTDQEVDSPLYSEETLWKCKKILNDGGKVVLQAGCPINNKEMHQILLERVAKIFGNVSMVSEFIECYGEHQSFIIGEVK